MGPRSVRRGRQSMGINIASTLDQQWSCHCWCRCRHRCRSWTVRSWTSYKPHAHSNTAKHNNQVIWWRWHLWYWWKGPLSLAKDTANTRPSHFAAISRRCCFVCLPSSLSSVLVLRWHPIIIPSRCHPPLSLLMIPFIQMIIHLKYCHDQQDMEQHPLKSWHNPSSRGSWWKKGKISNGFYGTFSCWKW